ncbi:MAG: hypothetical protein ABJA87_02210 [bacterium]
MTGVTAPGAGSVHPWVVALRRSAQRYGRRAYALSVLAVVTPGVDPRVAVSK